MCQTYWLFITTRTENEEYDDSSRMVQQMSWMIAPNQKDKESTTRVVEEEDETLCE
jgi:hypothetical protein